MVVSMVTNMVAKSVWMILGVGVFVWIIIILDGSVVVAVVVDVVVSDVVVGIMVKVAVGFTVLGVFVDALVTAYVDSIMNVT